MGSGNDVFITDGPSSAVDGEVTLGSGNDAFISEFGSQIGGQLSLGDGDDTFVGFVFDQGGVVDGGAGNDSYYIADPFAAFGVPPNSVVEHAGEGFDQIFTSVDYTLTGGSEIEILWANAGATGLMLTGNELDNGIVGGAGNDTLVGAEGNDILVSQGAADTMLGGTGDDIYYVNNSSDVVTEFTGEGHDTVYATADFALTAGSEVEVLWANAGATGLTLTGNELSNGLVGGAGHDTLNGGGGNDTLVSQGFADTMAGGTGDDTYYVNNSADVVIENVGEGHDTVYATVDFILTAGSEVEAIWSMAGATGLTLTGNELDNGLVGGAGHDTLNGGGGNDTMVSQGLSDTMAGGTGDDIYYINNSADVVTENAGEGFDKVYATIDYALQAGSSVEWLQAVSDAGLKLTGNELGNSVLGGAGADTLDGGAGVDFLFGGAGTDQFVFNKGQADGDTVMDFSAGDHIDLFGYGAGATLTEVGNTDAYLITPDAANGGAAAAETIHISNVFNLNTADYLFH